MRRGWQSPDLPRQRGATGVEFAIGATAFLMLVFGMVEVSRAMYLWNTLANATRVAARAAATTDFNDASAVSTLLNRAVFKYADGSLPMGDGIDGSYLQLDYLQSDGTTRVSPMPRCPAENVVECTRNPEGSSCIRFVRVQLCAAPPGADGVCTATVPFEPMIAFEGLFPKGVMKYPTFAAVTPAGSLGYMPGSAGTCP